MASCEVCGNEYYLSFDVIMNDERFTFDSFECAIQRLAPHCEHCGCRIIGHGVYNDTGISAERGETITGRFKMQRQSRLVDVFWNVG